MYVDTSLIVTAITQESATAATQSWLRENASGDVAVSWWVGTELASALAQKLRIGDLSAAQRGVAWATWLALAAGWRLLAVERRHFTDAADLTSKGVRAGDALHLAVARDRASALATRDRTMAAVARELGMIVHHPT